MWVACPAISCDPPSLRRPIVGGVISVVGAVMLGVGAEVAVEEVPGANVAPNFGVVARRVGRGP